ncbi:MAG TPA: redoxin family protein [Tenuifilum sp.]|uniref:TlpA family protein disulfide reductase n=1 Tax=Tenuifilum sp. TaxID=2760880 RepID=UPI002CBEF7CB|nr:redoxin family protein [Tenuifilum sp.]HOK86241.1 redoxin family protein [Tenuifilum sp.]HON69938.1 redoxin family protein [Tenuifilum sp.]HRR11804.1 redoxin family protein [Tenuifilum sp.]HRS43847.1 redoxin family protein [Tenuifilum sp.]
MRKYLIYLTIPAMVACGSKEPKPTTLAGRYTNGTDNKVIVISPDAIDTISLNENGLFVHKVNLANPAMLKVRSGRIQTTLYLEPGDSSYFEVDANNADGISFSGSNSELNQNLRSRSKELQNIFRGWRDLFSLNLNEFGLKIDSISKELFQKTDSLKAKSKNFAEMEANRVRYFMLRLRSQYPEYSAYLSGEEFNPDSADYSFFDNVDMNNGEHLSYDEYASLVETYAQLRIQKAQNFKELSSKPAQERLPAIFSMIDSIFTNPKIRDYVKKQYLMEEIQFGEFWKLNDICNNYLAACTTPVYKQEVQSVYNEKLKIAPGNSAPTFTYNDINGKSVSLSDFNGKLVYIDFWATWCGPCRGEIPHLDKLEKDYKGKKIVFVKISLDDDMDAWRKMVTEKKLGGVQLHADGAWSSDAAKNYQIKGIPTFVLIGANGKIINPNAPRPSSEEIRTLLDQELAKI